MSVQADSAVAAKLKKLIRSVPDFPKPSIVFRDITTLLADSQGLNLACDAMAKAFVDQDTDLVVGTESRGFIFGTPIARQLDRGFVLIRKPGKLPAPTISQEYQLEYGTDKLEIHSDAIKPGQRVLLVDDLLATGGTMKACCQLVEQLGGKIVGIVFLIELGFLNGREVLKNYPVESIITYDSE